MQKRTVERWMYNAITVRAGIALLVCMAALRLQLWTLVVINAAFFLYEAVVLLGSKPKQE